MKILRNKNNADNIKHVFMHQYFCKTNSDHSVCVMTMIAVSNRIKTKIYIAKL